MYVQICNTAFLNFSLVSKQTFLKIMFNLFLIWYYNFPILNTFFLFTFILEKFQLSGK